MGPARSAESHAHAQAPHAARRAVCLARGSVLRLSLLVMIACSLPSGAAATTWPAPITPLTDADRMEYAVSGNALPGLVAVEAVGDSADADGDVLFWMNVRPVRWYRGQGPHRPVRIIVSPVAQELYFRVASWMAEGPVVVVLFALERNGQLYARGGPSLPGGGVLRPEPAQLPEIEASIASAIERTSPEGLERRSDLVLVGQVLDLDRDCNFEGRVVGCTRVAVDSVLAGKAPSDTIDVHDDYGPLFRRGPKLLCLRRAGTAYRVVGAANGMSPIVAGRAEWHGAPISEVARRIRASRARRARGEK